jgi:hypothetical protein
MTEVRETGARNEADIARTDHRDFHKCLPLGVKRT